MFVRNAKFVEEAKLYVVAECCVLRWVFVEVELSFERWCCCSCKKEGTRAAEKRAGGGFISRLPANKLGMGINKSWVFGELIECVGRTMGCGSYCMYFLS